MPSLKPSGRVAVETRPLNMLYVADRNQEFSLEEVLDGLWNSNVSEVRKQCLHLLTTYRFRATSNLRTRAFLRDTILECASQFYSESLQPLLKLYIRYSMGYWVDSKLRPSGVTPTHVERRYERVVKTGYLFLVKLYTSSGEADSTWGGNPDILKAFMKGLTESVVGSHKPGLFAENASQVMLMHFCSSFTGATVRNPASVGGWFMPLLVQIARFCHHTIFYDKEVHGAFRRIAQAVDRGTIVLSDRDAGEVEKMIARLQLLATLDVLRSTLHKNAREIDYLRN